MRRYLILLSHTLLIFYISLSSCVSASSSSSTSSSDSPSPSRKGYSKGDVVPVTCLNRTIETGEHITDSHGNLQYIPFLTCNETSNAPLAFLYATPQSFTCTLDALSDELYHLIEYFVHSDVPLSCRVPSYPLTAENAAINLQNTLLSTAAADALPNQHPALDAEKWTPLTIALQGTLQLSHLHLHTNINVLFHTTRDASETVSVGANTNTNTNTAKGGAPEGETSHLIASTAYSLPNTVVLGDGDGAAAGTEGTEGTESPRPGAGTSLSEGTKIIRNEPVVFTFNVGWIDGNVLPGMVGRPVLGITDHSVGFSLLSFFAIAGAAGVGALGMLVYERRKSGRGIYGNGLLGGNVGVGTGTGTGIGLSVRNTPYGGYGGYGGYSSNSGKRD